MSQAGSAAVTITTSQGHMGTALVLDTSGLTTESVEIDCQEHAIYVNNSRDMSIYVSGDYPVLRGNGATTVAWTNDTFVGSQLFTYRESDYV